MCLSCIHQLTLCALESSELGYMSISRRHKLSTLGFMASLLIFATEPGLYTSAAQAFWTLATYHIVSYLSYPIISYHTLSYPIMSFHILSCPIISYHILSYPIISIISYHIYLSIYLSVRPSVHPSIHLSIIHMYVYIYTYRSCQYQLQPCQQLGSIA